jgi:MFS family permease
VVALGVMPSFGLMFGDFIRNCVGSAEDDDVEGGSQESSAISLITSSFFSALSFAGLFTNTLIRKTSCRFVGLTGAFLYFTGSVMTIFVTSVTQLLISFSIFQGSFINYVT